jgi:hypothetical protein
MPRPNLLATNPVPLDLSANPDVPGELRPVPPWETANGPALPVNTNELAIRLPVVVILPVADIRPVVDIPLVEVISLAAARFHTFKVPTPVRSKAI